MDEIKEMSEAAAQKLSNVLKFITIEDYSIGANKLIEDIIESAEISIKQKVAMYLINLIEASFITKWYWKRKLTKAEKRLTKFNKINLKY